MSFQIESAHEVLRKLHQINSEGLIEVAEHQGYVENLKSYQRGKKVRLTTVKWQLGWWLTSQLQNQMLNNEVTVLSKCKENETRILCWAKLSFKSEYEVSTFSDVQQPERVCQEHSLIKATL